MTESDWWYLYLGWISGMSCLNQVLHEENPQTKCQAHWGGNSLGSRGVSAKLLQVKQHGLSGRTEEEQCLWSGGKGDGRRWAYWRTGQEAQCVQESWKNLGCCLLPCKDAPEHLRQMPGAYTGDIQNGIYIQLTETPVHNRPMMK
jgi:hypothetical protein